MGNAIAFKKRPGFGLVMLLISGMCWASIAIFSKIGIESGLNAVTVNVARMFVGGGIVFLYLLLFRRSAFRVTLRQGVLLMFLGILDYTIGGLCFIGSLHFIDSSLAFLVLYTYPAIVVILSVALGREKFNPMKFIAVLLTIIGVGFVLEAGMAISGEEWIGVGLVLSAAAIFSVYLISVESLLENVRPSSVSLYSLLSGAAGLLLVIPFVPVQIEEALQPTNLFILLFIAIVSTALSLVTFLVGVRHVGATRAAVLTTLEPIFVVIIAGIFLGESLSGWQMFGVVLQLSGVVLVNKEPHRLSEPGPA